LVFNLVIQKNNNNNAACRAAPFLILQVRYTL
jgi:hypothetical protein